MSVGAHRAHRKTPECAQEPTVLADVPPRTRGWVGAQAPVPRKKPDTILLQEAAGGGAPTPGGSPSPPPPPDNETPPPPLPPGPTGMGAMPSPKGPTAPIYPDPPTVKYTVELPVETFAYFDAARASFGYDKPFSTFLAECVDDLFNLLGYDGIRLVPRQVVDAAA